ncbi:MAG: sensor histidine kinase [Bacteroidales bacterium]
MKNFSFRVKIIATIILVVSLFSIISFSFFNIFLKNKLITQTEENYLKMNLLRDQFYFTIGLHDGRIIKSMLKNTEKDKDVLKTYLVNSKLKVTYPNNYSSLGKDTSDLEKIFSQDKNIFFKSYNKTANPFNRVFIKMLNAPTCYACHDNSQKNLGIIILDLSDHETQGIISFTRRFSFYYTFFILLSIFLMVGYLHYKYIRKSLNQFRTAINMINQGKLEKRLAIPEVRELGSLGKDFNEMLNTIEKAQQKLQIYHQRELQNSQKLATIGEMTARIAHEIRNPVTGIARAMEIIIADTKDSENKPILEEIQRQANRVNQAISNMLKFSRSKDIFLVEGDINEVLKSLVFFLKHQSHDKTINLTLNLQQDLPKFNFDHELIENVLLNLSFNAIQSVRENGTIIFTTKFDVIKKTIIISVWDNGTGISSESGTEIFKPFYTTRTKGTGLGLAISKDIIDKHKGEIWYVNHTSEQGCTFYISLPV